MPHYTLIADQSQGLPYFLLSSSDSSPDTPLVLILHGLGSQKEKILPILYAFAQAGFRVAALDARLHGERTDAEEREARLTGSYFETMFDIVTGTARDVSTLLDHLEVERAGIHGISLGGFITFAALLGEPRLQAAAVAMGSPDWLGPLREMGIDVGQPTFAPLRAMHPLDQAGSSYPIRPLLMLHGTEDDVVSPLGVEALYDRLRPAYSETPNRLELVLYPDLGHQYTPEMQERSIAWMKRFL